MVRARFANDITRVFPEAEVIATPNRDYPFRAYMDPQEVILYLGGEIGNIDYAKFKPEVKEPARHNAYMDVWSVMYTWQTDVTGKPGLFGMGWRKSGF